MESTRGILRPHDGALPWRRLPAADLAHLVEYLWSVSWDLEAPVVRETLPHPSVHLAIQAGESGVHGVVRRRFTTRLEGRGSVFAVRFRPGGFFPLLGRPVSELTDRVRPLPEIFGEAGARLEAAVLADEGLEARTLACETFLRERLPPPDPAVDFVARAVERAAADRTLTRVEDFAERLGTSVRTLQRIFRRYVGVSPKWVIQRYRLQEAAERLASADPGAASRMALELGYVDQAHFIRDFRAVIGVPPAEYARCAAPPIPGRPAAAG